jgi:hypothetical protein
MIRSIRNLLVLLLAVFATAGVAGAATGPGLLGKLTVTAENNVGYDRDAFKHWITLPGGDCDVRQWVLYRQDRASGRACGNERGDWVSVYDGKRLTVSRELDIDHMVPLAEAWGSGASGWSNEQREAFANDLYKFSLIAVSASSNRSKSDRDPAEWLPPRRAFICKYVARWTAVKYRWKLSLDPSEKRTIRRTFTGCPKGALRLGPVPRAKLKGI